MNVLKRLIQYQALLLLFVLFFSPPIESRRRKKIVDKYDYQPTSQIAKNERPPATKTSSFTKSTTDREEEIIEEASNWPIEKEDFKEELNKNHNNPEGHNNRENEVKDIFLNFDNADLKTFVDYIGNLKKINVLTDPKIAGNKISLTIRDALSVDGAWNIFLTILEMSGFSIIKAGDVHKIIPKKEKLTEPLPVFIGTPSEKLPDNDLTIRYVTFLTNIPISQARGLLQGMLSQPSKIIDHPNANGFVITDKSYNIKAAMKVIQELDRSDVKQSVTVMRLKQANANDVKKLFASLMQKPEGNPLARLLGRTPETSVEYFPPTTKIIAEPRTNSLILLGDQKSIRRIEDFIVKYVDTELKGVKSPIHLYELKHTDVEQIKDILETVSESAADSPAAKYGGIRGGVKYFKKMRFAMDKANNRLLVSSTDDQDWKLLKKTIQSLDKPQPQVALETLIVSINFDDTKQLGAQIRNKKHGQFGQNMNAQAAHITNVIYKEQEVPDNGGTRTAYSLLGDLLQKMTFGIGSTVLSFGKVGDVWGLVRMLKTQTNTNVLYKPFIIAKNMRKAHIKVGEKRRVTYQKAVAELSGNQGDATGYQDATAEISIAVKPQINLDGVITLDIGVDLSEFQESTEVDRPDTYTKKLDTKVSIANGQVLVLGGFVKTKIIENTYRTPVLGSIPVLGWLFKEKKREVNKEYIFIFMAPTIVKPRKAPGANLYTKMKLYAAKGDIDDAIEVQKTKDPIFNWFFNGEKETYSHKIVDYTNARYQPTSVDIINDPYYRAVPLREEKKEEEEEIKPPTPPEPPIKPEIGKKSPPEEIQTTQPITKPGVIEKPENKIEEVKKEEEEVEEEAEEPEEEEVEEEAEEPEEEEIEEKIEEARRKERRQKLQQLFSSSKPQLKQTVPQKKRFYRKNKLKQLLTQTPQHLLQKNHFLAVRNQKGRPL